MQHSLEWPDSARIVTRRRKNPTVGFIERLFYNSGTVFLVTYLLLKSVVIPTLSANYEQREDLSASTLMALRKLVSSLQKRLKYTPVSAIGFNEGDTGVERSTQTCDATDAAGNQAGTRWQSLCESVQDATSHLQHFNDTIKPLTFMDGLSFQMKLVVDELQLDTSSESEIGTCNKIVSSIREVKGWFVNGRIA